MQNIVTSVESLIRRDNETKCATRTDGACLCVLMDVSQKPESHVWIGTPSHPSSFIQEIVYKTLPTFCSKYHIQGHNLVTCKALVKDDGKWKETGQVWRPKQLKTLENVEKLGIQQIQELKESKDVEIVNLLVGQGIVSSVSVESLGEKMALKENCFKVGNTSRVSSGDQVLVVGKNSDIHIEKGL